MTRRIRQIIVFLLLGALLNIAVAWACALLVSPWGHGFVRAYEYSDRHFLDPDFGMLEVWRMKRLGAVDINVDRIRKSRMAPTDDESARELLPVWTGLREPSEAYAAGGLINPQTRLPAWKSGAIGAEFAIVEVRGWPMLSMWVCHGETYPATGVWTRYGLKLSWLKPRMELNGSPYPVALPLKPRPLGFAVNTAFYAASLALLTSGFAAFRRRRRRRRGLCEACGYPSGASAVCTECGSAVAGNLARL